MKKLQQFLIPALLLYLGLSCVQDDQVSPTDPLAADLNKSIQKARIFFENKFDPATQDEASHRNSKAKRHSLKKTLKWNKATIRELANGEEGIVIPVSFEEELYVNKQDTAQSLSNLTYILYYLDEKGKENIEVVTTFPDSTFLEQNDPNAPFTGLVYVENWNGKLLKSYLYKNGRISLYDPKQKKSKDRLIYCENIIDYYTCVETGTGVHLSCRYQETEITFSPCDDSGSEYYVVYGYTPSTGSSGDGGSGSGDDPNDDDMPEVCNDGYVSDGKGGCIKIKPCPGDPVRDPQIAEQKISGVVGGMHGCTRLGGACSVEDRTKWHDGVDIANEYGEPIYAMYDGYIYNSLYQNDGFGYWTQIQSTVNGQTIITQYAHLQRAGRVKSGSVKAGDIIGYQGDSGNLKGAIEDESTVSHVHIGVLAHDGSGSWNYHDNFQEVDPRAWFASNIDNSGNTSTTNCP